MKKDTLLLHSSVPSHLLIAWPGVSVSHPPSSPELLLSMFALYLSKLSLDNPSARKPYPSHVTLNMH